MTVAGVRLVTVKPGPVTETESGAVAVDVGGPPHPGAQGPVPVTVAIAVPPVAIGVALRPIVNVVAPVPGVMLDVTPAGSPLTESVTAPL
jgi:hypothetical protein